MGVIPATLIAKRGSGSEKTGRSAGGPMRGAD
jgi:hypothetical protein